LYLRFPPCKTNFANGVTNVSTYTPRRRHTANVRISNLLRLALYNIQHVYYIYIYYILYLYRYTSCILYCKVSTMTTRRAERGGFPQPPINAVIIRLSNARYRGTLWHDGDQLRGGVLQQAPSNYRYIRASYNDLTHIFSRTSTGHST